MEQCPHCGSDVPAGAPFCPQCGEVVLGGMLRQVCPICQATLPPEAQFCPECGAPVLVGALPPTSAMRADGLRGVMGLAAPPTTPRETSSQDTEQGNSLRARSETVGADAGAPPPPYSTFTTFPTTPGMDALPFAGVWPITVAPDTPTLTPRAARSVGGRVWALALQRTWTAIAASMLLLLVLAYVIPVALGRHDWATGARVVGGVAAALAVMTFAGLGLWALGPNRPRRDIAVGLITTILLAILAIGGLAGGPSIRATQATFAAQHNQWAEAITEDRLLGTPAATQQALAVYATWMGADPASVPYPATIAYLASLRTKSACASACQQSATNDEAEALYLYGQQLVRAHHEQDAIAQFTSIARLAPGSAYALQAHSAAAGAYLTLAQQQAAAHACGPEVTYYQTLAKDYADTPQGSQAQSLLAAGTTVTGTVTGLPNPTATTLYLSTSATPYHYFSDDYSAHPSANGNFTFTGVQPGKYNLSGTGSFGLTYWHDATPPYNPYTITVGLICPVNAGSYPY